MSHKQSCCLLALLTFAAVSPVRAQLTHAPIYKPPVQDAPKVRVDGRTRGTDDVLLTLTVLAPEHVGLTTKEQPTLFWYQSKAAKAKFELTISEVKSVGPLLEVKFDRVPTDGIQRLRLADHKVTLKPGVEYRWSVAILIDEESRSKDIVASGVIKRVEPGPTLKKRLTGAPDADLPFIYADEGIWYDSLETLSDLIDKQQQDKGLREARAVYFMQAGLPEAAFYEMRAAGKTATAQTK